MKCLVTVKESLKNDEDIAAASGWTISEARRNIGDRKIEKIDSISREHGVWRQLSIKHNEACCKSFFQPFHVTQACPTILYLFVFCT